MIRTNKTKLTALFMMLLILFSALFIPINATGESIDFYNGNELTPVIATSCMPSIYVTKSIPETGLQPNTTYYKVNQNRSIIYSRAITDDNGNTSFRYDLVSHNGEELHHGNVRGPHIHYYWWKSYTNENGQTFYNYARDPIIVPYY